MTVPPRRASTICVIRPGVDRIQVLMVRRTETAPFMAGAWVFPGGTVSEEDEGELAIRAVACDDPHERSWAAAALRELVEETGLWLTTSGVRTGRGGEVRGEEVYRTLTEEGTQLAGGGLHYFANWITPYPLPIRFDTRFYATAVAQGYDPVVDQVELDDAAWIEPDVALGRFIGGDWALPFPTAKTLEFLAAFENVPAVLSHIAGLPPVEPVQPRIAVSAERVDILLPQEPGFAEADPALIDAEDLISRISDAVRRGAEVPAEMRRR